MSRSKPIAASLAVLLWAMWWLWPAPEAETVVRGTSQPTASELRRTKASPPPRPPSLSAPDRPFDAPEVSETQDTGDICGLCEAGVLDDDEVCAPCGPLTGELALEIYGPGADDARVEVSGCEAWRIYEGSAGHSYEGFHYEARPGVCTVRARRRDGLLIAFSDPVEVQITAGVVTTVELDLPEERTGGLGVAFAVVDGGIRIERVWPGTPAAQMGLESGDLILEVDGIPTVELDQWDFVRAMTGPEGSEVEFVLGFDGAEGPEEEAITLVRQYLDRS